MVQTDDNESYKLLLGLIKKKTGFKCENYTENFLKRRISSRMYALHVNSFSDYILQLNSNPAEKDLLLEELTIHVTNFFRNRDAFEIFIAETLMELMDRKTKNNDKCLNIWSAGCSSGEEPYTLAMVLIEMLQWRIKEYSINILGTDLSASTILKEKKGEYEEIQLKEAPSDYIKKYFIKQGEIYKIKDEVKKLVRFEVGDILSGILPKNQDILFCRNVVIYFNAEQKEKLYMNFYNSLAIGGYLVLGMTETLTGPAKDKFKLFNNANRIYKK
jgi:chemotaxis methyl-accepting protein methylase